ncbi:ABC transporter permease [Alsobacter sp. SYSU M60028]|uniref:ABC transporter permease n=1 Tax=Alsobacter ponti TaxID=2962936 RepID=A0ABT1L934_9HYPH|nr:ABC transporter permease [Alsobacter ponti]MCP8938005.1 ABC transporter permease [Alsobacter ponti]
MSRWFANVFRLGLKELASLRRDTVMTVLVVYAFSVAVYSVANGTRMDVHNASIAVVDLDRSMLSARIRDALRPPFFRTPVLIDGSELDAGMDRGAYTFVIQVPPRFEADLLAGRKPSLQINVDATAMTQALTGASYIQSIVAQECAAALGMDGLLTAALEPTSRALFNPNLEGVWFTAVMQVIENVTILSIVLVGAAVVREREHGTIEHLLVMPLRPSEIAAAKIWANGAVILLAAVLSLHLVVRLALGVPIPGSTALFTAGATIYLFAVTSLGVLIATVARSMPQLGLLAIPIFVVMNLLSGATTPLETMPQALQWIMQLSPSTHFVAFAQAILYRGAGIDIVWPQMLLMAGIGALFLGVALARFRSMLEAQS